MSRTPKRRDTEEESPPVLVASRTRMTMEAAGEPGFSPPADINETKEGITIRLELPGVPASSIGVFIQGMTIEVVGEKGPDHFGPEASFLCVERAFGRFYRAFDLTGCLDMTRVAVELKGGVLSICIPKCEERRGRRRRIPIREAP